MDTDGSTEPTLDSTTSRRRPRSTVRVLLGVVAVVVIAAAGVFTYLIATDKPIARLCTIAGVIRTDPPAADPEDAVDAWLRSHPGQIGPLLRSGYQRNGKAEWRHYDGPRSYSRILVRQTDGGWSVYDANHCVEQDA